MQTTDIAQLLPEVFRRTNSEGSPLAAILSVMEALHAPTEQTLATLDTNFNPHTCPKKLLPLLAEWVDLERFLVHPSTRSGSGDGDSNSIASLRSGDGRLRELIYAAQSLSQIRGTSVGLKKFLHFATGIDNFTIDENSLTSDNRPRPFHIVVRAPAAALQHETLVRKIIEQEKPAFVTYDLEIENSQTGAE